MSFESSLDSIIALISLTNTLRTRFRDAPLQFKAVSDEINSFSMMVRNLEHDLPVLDLTVAQERDLTSCIEPCKNVLEDLCKLIDRCQELESLSSWASSKTRREWRETIRDFTEVQALQSRISSSTSALNVLYSSFNSAKLQYTPHDIDQVEINQERVNPFITLPTPSQLPPEFQRWLKAPDAVVEYRDACNKSYSNTGQWLVDSAIYTNWLRKANSFLWLYGLAGCGKSVLCGTTIRSALQSRGSNSNIGVAFFYFSFKDRSKQTASNMLRALIFQLSSQAGDNYKRIRQLYNRCIKGEPPISGLMTTLRTLIQHFQHVHIFIDALDECPQGLARNELLTCLEELHRASISGLHVLITSRELADIQGYVQGLGPGVSMKNEAVDKDIAEFIAGHLQQSQKLKKWSAYHELIKDTLTSNANGVFRWVECQFILLASCPSSKACLDSALASLPHSLDETYEIMLSNIPNEKIKDAKRILTLLCFAQRPLRLNEVLDAIAVELEGVPKFNIESRDQYLEDLVGVCPGLIEISYVPHEKYWHNCGMFQALRIAHFSVREYLESVSIREHTSSFFSIQCDVSHNEIARILLVYLLDPALSVDQVESSIFSQRPLITYAAEYWYYHCSRTHSNVERVEELAVQLLRDKPNNWRNCIRIDSITGNHLDSYQDQAIHAVYSASALGLSSILLRLLTVEREESESGFEKPEKHVSSIINAQADTRHTYALTAASSEGHDKVVQILLDNGADVNAQGGYWGNALQAASYMGHEMTVKILLNSGADVNAQGGIYVNALQAAFAGIPPDPDCSNHEKIIQILVENGADVNAQGGNYGNALQAAIHKGYEKMVQLLVENGANINTEDRYGNALYKACYIGRERITQILVDNGADVNIQGGEYGNALQAASCFGREKIVQILLDNDANINAQGGQYGNALQAACVGNNEKIVQILLDNDANINAQGGQYGNALQAACIRNNEKIVQILINSSADVNAQGGKYGNALQAASAHGDGRIVRLLLRSGADVNAQGGEEHNNALEAASRQGHENIVQILLENGAKVNAQEGSSSSALQAACLSGNERIVKMLLERGADVNAQRGEKYKNALQAASSGHCEKIVQLLLNNGAEVNAQGGLSNNALQAACFSGSQRVVELLLENGADINAQGGGQYSNALQAASGRGYGKLVQILLDNNAEVNAQGGQYGSALYAACVWSHERVVKVLLENGADANIRGGYYGTVLQVACFYRKAGIVEILVENGADVNAQEGHYGNAMQLACHMGSADMVQILLDNGADINIQGGFFGNALQSASSSITGDRKLVQMLLDKGADINAQGGHFGNALYAACSTGHEELVQVLLDNGANIDAEGGQCGNALKVASFEGRERILQILLDNGADINAGGPQGNALYAAVLNGKKNIVRLLLDRGAEISPKLEGDSLLVLAIAENHLEIARLLIERGIDVNAEGTYYNALQIASGLGLYEMVQLLIEQGADVHAKGPQGNALDFVALAQKRADGDLQLEPSSENAGPTALTDLPVQFENVLRILLDAGAGKNGEAQRVASLEIPEVMKQLLLTYHE